jgi:hypothetical protein
MSHRSFCVERLGVGDWPMPESKDGAVISVEAWDALEDLESVPVGAVVFTFDVTPDRGWASIAAAARRPDGLWHLEVVEHRRGTKWVPDRLAELLGEHESLPEVGYSGSSPAAALVPAVEDVGVKLRKLTAPEDAQACGGLFDAVADATVRHRGRDEHTQALREALRGAAKQNLGDAWKWSRRSSAVDISPLVAVTHALFIARGGDGPSVYEDRGVFAVTLD